MLLGWLIATISTRSNGLFVQKRVGRHGKLFPLFKLKTMRPVKGVCTSVTSTHDVRITPSGKWLRKLKIDELPQLINVLFGQMSLVGPRPDVPGFADKLTGDDRVVLSMRPGITGPASLAFRNEEEILADVDDPEKYNREVIWPKKVVLNRQYLQTQSLVGDTKIILQTIFGTRLQ
ncbi:UNVERIFIED_CONTAM: hypothetical protein GTU68_042990 [Idotea baltica]|nr:hypothetical protein [Idotea baltica]